MRARGGNISLGLGLFHDKAIVGDNVGYNLASIYVLKIAHMAVAIYIL